MPSRHFRIVVLTCFCIAMCVVNGYAQQNTKGDRTGPSEVRAKKSTSKKSGKIRSGKRSSSKAFKSSKGKRAAYRSGSPMRAPSDGSKNVYPQNGRFVNNQSQTPRSAESRSGSRRIKTVRPRSASSSLRNVYPQSGPINYSSAPSTPPRTRRVRPRTASTTFVSRQSSREWTNAARPKPRKERAYTKDISGKKIRTKNFRSPRPPVMTQQNSEFIRSATPKQRNVYSQGNRVVRNPEKAKRRTVTFTNERYPVNPASRPRYTQRAASNSAQLARVRKIQNRTRPTVSGGGSPSSASRPFISSGKENNWRRFPRPKRKREQAVTTDIAGKPLRTKNFRTQRPVIVNPTSHYRRPAPKTGDRPYSGPAGGRAVSRSESGKAWRGDITNRRIRKNFSSKKTTAGKAVVSAQKRRYGMRNQGEGFAGLLKGKRAAKGGGSISGGLWNNKNQSIQGRSPGIGARGVDKFQGRSRSGKTLGDQGETFTGSLKARRPLKGGGSISGKLWNNNQRAIQSKTPSLSALAQARFRGMSKQQRQGFASRGETYSGKLKARRPLKGGGSISGKMWNNRQQPIQPKFPSLSAIAQSRFRGDFKTRRPVKGGGSISGKSWNNNQNAINGRSPGIGARGIEKYQGNVRAGKGYRDQGEEYTGNIKAHRPVKGGGSISGKPWNNNQRAVAGHSPGIGAKGVDKYQGNLLVGKLFRDQGEEYTGNIKAHRPVKGGGSVSGKTWNNNGSPIAVRTPSNKAAKVGNYSGNIKGGQKVYNDQGEEFTGFIKQKKYLKNPNAAEASIKVTRAKTVDATGGLQIKVKQHDYARRKNAPEGSIPGLVASKTSMKASVAARGAKQYHYVRNQSSSDESLKVREASKAFARASDYQGNIKMKKFDLFGKRNLHPDAQFVKTNKNNVPQEKDAITNFKLWWSRLFRKNETQPDHLKSKQHKPRYDRGEAGLWYD